MKSLKNEIKVNIIDQVDSTIRLLDLYSLSDWYEVYVYQIHFMTDSIWYEVYDKIHNKIYNKIQDNIL